MCQCTRKYTSATVREHEIVYLSSRLGREAVIGSV